ncbi:hypothetical protein TNIN_447341 [Trichonephila inaurata madagascariensis]|uniref:Uncharacterized protein n=1 Tax=Trichonephila inaurata madagascariensis TaxID=2747483 RepID=A0A8X6M5P8_9ARAC|nr:hypothetical protein TNIN_447341 [Trichonephila inaurata madagascariensis]
MAQAVHYIVLLDMELWQEADEDSPDDLSLIEDESVEIVNEAESSEVDEDEHDRENYNPKRKMKPYLDIMSVLDACASINCSRN